MSRRTAITYTSEDVPKLKEQDLYIYYCKNSGLHALTTTCNLAKAPRRKTDHSIVIDTSLHTSKFSNTLDGGITYIKRAHGGVEKQHRIKIGKLPIAYRAEPEERFVYILDDALTAYSAEESADARGKLPVPPCITRGGDGLVRVALHTDEEAKHSGVIEVRADYVLAQIKGSMQRESGQSELLQLFQNVLGVRLGQLHLSKRALEVKDLEPDQVFERLQKACYTSKTEQS